MTKEEMKHKMEGRLGMGSGRSGGGLWSTALAGGLFRLSGSGAKACCIEGHA